jgi:phosphatidylserine synthase
VEVKDRFSLLYESLKDEFNRYFEGVAIMWAANLIGIGWVLTSDQSRDFIAKQRAAFWGLLAAIVVVGIVHIGVCRNHYLRSQQKFNLITREFTDSAPPYIEKEYYMSYKITPLMIWSHLAVSLILLAVLFMMVFSLRYIV